MIIYDKSKRCDLAHLEKNLLILRKRKLLFENTADLKKFKGKADLKKLVKIPFALEPIVRKCDLENNFLTFRKVV